MSNTQVGPYNNGSSSDDEYVVHGLPQIDAEAFRASIDQMQRVIDHRFGHLFPAAQRDPFQVAAVAGRVLEERIKPLMGMHNVEAFLQVRFTGDKSDWSYREMRIKNPVFMALANTDPEKGMRVGDIVGMLQQQHAEFRDKFRDVHWGAEVNSNHPIAQCPPSVNASFAWCIRIEAEGKEATKAMGIKITWNHVVGKEPAPPALADREVHQDDFAMKGESVLDTCSVASFTAPSTFNHWGDWRCSDLQIKDAIKGKPIGKPWDPNEKFASVPALEGPPGSSQQALLGDSRLGDSRLGDSRLGNSRGQEAGGSAPSLASLTGASELPQLPWGSNTGGATEGLNSALVPSSAGESSKPALPWHAATSVETSTFPAVTQQMGGSSVTTSKGGSQVTRSFGFSSPADLAGGEGSAPRVELHPGLLRQRPNHGLPINVPPSATERQVGFPLQQEKK